MNHNSTFFFAQDNTMLNLLTSKKIIIKCIMMIAMFVLIASTITSCDVTNGENLTPSISNNTATNGESLQNPLLADKRVILVESQTGEFDIDLQMATYLAWESRYESKLIYYQYVQYGIMEDTLGITSLYSAEEYALKMAHTGIQNSWRNCIDDISEQLKNYVALCDMAHKEGITLTEEDEIMVEEVIDWLNQLSAETNMNFDSLGDFLNHYIKNGVQEKDVRTATKIVILCNKYIKQKEIEFNDNVSLISWIEEIISSYNLNENALKIIGDPTPTTEENNNLIVGPPNYTEFTYQ